MTTTDTAALLAACRADPQNMHAVLILAEAVQESGRERDAVYLRCTADPDNDVHRHALASLWERDDPVWAELCRVQCELARHPEGHRCRVAVESQQQIPGYKYICECDPCNMARREAALLAARTARWRRGPKCGACYRGSVPTDRDDDTCPRCWGTGDAGGLMRHDPHDECRWLHDIEHIRGCLRVHCTLAEAWAPVVPTDWIRAVCRHHAVSEVWLTDKRPFLYVDAPKYGWSRDRPTYRDDPANVLPPTIWDLLPSGSVHDTPELARLALARAVALAVRLDLEERL